MLTRPATRRPDRGGVTAVFASCAQGQEGARAGPAQPLLGRRAPRLVQAGASQGGAACLTRPQGRRAATGRDPPAGWPQPRA